MRKRLSVFILCILLAILAGCNQSNEGYQRQERGRCVENIKVENYFFTGINKQYYDKIPQRVLVIGANENELLLDLEAESSVLTAVNYQDDAEFSIKKSNRNAWNSLPKMPSNQINREHVLKVQPDLIIAQEQFFSKNYLESTDYWNDKGVFTMVSLNTTAPNKMNEPETVEKEMKFIKDMGSIFHKEKQSEKIVADTYRRIRMINEKIKKTRKPKVLILDWLSIMVSYGKNKIAGDMVHKIGGIVVNTKATINDEIIMQENPDIVFLVTYDDTNARLQKFAENKAFQHLNFIKNNTLFPIPLKYVYGPASRTIDAIGYMAERMYPGEFHFEKEYNFH